MAAGGHVVGGGVAQHAGERVLARDVAAAPADDDGQLGLVVGLGRRRGARRDAERPVGVVEARGGLEEEGWVRGQREVHLRGVRAVVEPDAADRAGLARGQRREESADGEGGGGGLGERGEDGGGRVEADADGVVGGEGGADCVVGSVSLG